MSVHQIKHPLIQHKLGLLRKAGLSTKQFRELTNELATLISYEATRDLPTESVQIGGWAGHAIEVERIRGKKITLVPILRAGFGMLEGVLTVIPNAKISVLGLYRDEETLQPVAYFDNVVKDVEQRTALILDPMLATAGTAIASIDLLKKKGCKNIIGMFLVSAPEGIQALTAAHPDAEIYVAAIDKHLNEKGYILPGLGDAGDKIFGTKPLK